MSKSTSVLAAAGALTLATLMTPGAAHASTPSPDVVSFTGESVGSKPNGYATASYPGALFQNTGGTGLYVSDYGTLSHGTAIAVLGSGYAGLEVRLTHPTTSLSLAFGNDATGLNATDQGELTLYRGSAQVGQVDVNVNANGIMDQTVSYAGGRLFNRATFRYVDAAGNPKNSYEVVDDVTLAPLCTIAGGEGHDHLVGTSGADVVCGDTGNDVIRGGGGDDLIYPGPGADHVYGGSGADTVMGSAGSDVVVGADGRDDLRGGAGHDRLLGGPGNDQLTGGTGRDTCDGGAGNDYALSCEVRHHLP